MSKTTIIYAHPYEKSFNHAILERVQALLDAKGQAYQLIDLYADGFNPVFTKEELALFAEGKALDPLVLPIPGGAQGEQPPDLHLSHLVGQHAGHRQGIHR